MAEIEGPSLADKIKQRPLPLDEALDITAISPRAYRKPTRKALSTETSNHRM